MAKRRVTGRFYVFLAIVVTVILLVVFWDPIFNRTKVSVIMMATATDTRSADAIIVRDETLGSAETVTRVTYVASESTLVNPGDVIAYAYSSAYSEKIISQLEAVRANIQTYHKEILANIVDTQLDLLDKAVTQKAYDVKQLVTHKASGNLVRVKYQLEQAMVDRQEYMRQNKREDLKLNQLYEQESSNLNSIASWRTTLTAETGGVVSFYLDGLENALSIDRVGKITPDEALRILHGAIPETPADTRSGTNVFRIVNQTHWYLLIVSDDETWNPIIGQEYSFQLDGYSDLAYTGIVTGMQKSGSTVLAEMEISDPIGPLIGQRSGHVTIGTNITGLSVQTNAVTTVEGQTGVYLYDVPGGTFVPVDVLSSDGTYSIIQPLAEGALTSGQRILIK